MLDFNKNDRNDQFTISHIYKYIFEELDDFY